MLSTRKHEGTRGWRRGTGEPEEGKTGARHRLCTIIKSLSSPSAHVGTLGTDLFLNYPSIPATFSSPNQIVIMNAPLIEIEKSKGVLVKTAHSEERVSLDPRNVQVVVICCWLKFTLFGTTQRARCHNSNVSISIKWE